MSQFSPVSDRDHARAGSADTPDRCRNCGLDFMEHTNGTCPPPEGGSQDYERAAEIAKQRLRPETRK